MEKIKIIDSELFDLLEDHSDFRTGYLDIQTGDILMIFEDFDEEEQQEIIDKIENNPSQYISIEPIGSREGFRIMEKFVATLPEGEEHNILNNVISWQKPFSNFKNAISDMGDLRQQWFDFHDKQLRMLALEWLELRGIVAELVSYREKVNKVI